MYEKNYATKTRYFMGGTDADDSKLNTNTCWPKIVNL